MTTLLTRIQAHNLQITAAKHQRSPADKLLIEVEKELADDAETITDLRARLVVAETGNEDMANIGGQRNQRSRRNCDGQAVQAVGCSTHKERHDNMTGSKLYPPQSIRKLGNYYIAHVDAMTSEGLHSKADIAEQLAWRDQRIAELEAENKQLMAESGCDALRALVVNGLTVRCEIDAIDHPDRTVVVCTWGMKPTVFTHEWGQAGGMMQTRLAILDAAKLAQEANKTYEVKI